MRIWIIRHAESYSNTQGKLMSSTDLPLTDKGFLQAEAARDYLQAQLDTPAFDRVFSSPLLRAKQTAAILCGGEERIEVSSALQEMNLGKLEGMTWAERALGYPDVNMEGGLSGAALPEGESFGDVQARCNQFLDQLKGYGNHETILVASHGITIRVLINTLLGKPDHCANFINWADNAALTEVEWNLPTGEKTLKRLSDRAHLTDSGLGNKTYDIWGVFSAVRYEDC